MTVLQETWEKRASVRTKPRLLCDPAQSGYFYPKARQPLTIHPKIIDLDETQHHYLLTQSFYKYNNDIALIETRLVNQAILTVMTDALPVLFLPEQKIDLYTIMVDEAYHAYVAYDAMLQVERYTGIKPLKCPSTLEIELAIHAVINRISPDYHSIFKLIAVCIAENTLTKELIDMLNMDDTHPYFQSLIYDHATDETRHSGIFFHLLAHIWLNISNDCKQNIASVLVDFIALYLSTSMQMAFDELILSNMGFSAPEANDIVRDTLAHIQLSPYHPMLKNILIILTKAGVMDEYTTPYFEQKRWLLHDRNSRHRDHIL